MKKSIDSNHRLRTIYEKAYSILDKSTIGELKSSSSDDVFFRFNKSKLGIRDVIFLDNICNDNLSEMNKLKFPFLLKNIYKILGSSEREFSYQNFSFSSLNNIIERAKAYEKDGQSHFCDIGLCYHGMGWVIILTLNRTNGTLFLRLDGGSNGWDRDLNYRQFLKLNGSSPKINDKSFNIDSFFKNEKLFNEFIFSQSVSMDKLI